MAIPALMGYHYLAGRVEDLLTELEQRREELLGALVEVDNAQKAEA